MPHFDSSGKAAAERRIEDETGPIRDAVTLQCIEDQLTPTYYECRGDGWGPSEKIAQFLHVVAAERCFAAVAWMELLSAVTAPGGPCASVVPMVLHALASETVGYEHAIQYGTHRRGSSLADKALDFMCSCIVRTQRRGVALMREAFAVSENDPLTLCAPDVWFPVAAGLLSEAFDFAPEMQLDVLDALDRTHRYGMTAETWSGASANALLPNLSRLARAGNNDVATASVYLLSRLDELEVKLELRHIELVIRGLRIFLTNRGNSPLSSTCSGLSLDAGIRAIAALADHPASCLWNASERRTTGTSNEETDRKLLEVICREFCELILLGLDEAIDEECVIMLTSLARFPASKLEVSSACKISTSTNPSIGRAVGSADATPRRDRSDGRSLDGGVRSRGRSARTPQRQRA